MVKNWWSIEDLVYFLNFDFEVIKKVEEIFILFLYYIIDKVEVIFVEVLWYGCGFLVGIWIVNYFGVNLYILVEVKN